MKIFGTVISLIVASVLIAGMIAVGSPIQERNARFDARRVSDLQGIEGQVIYFWQSKRILPANLEKLGHDIPNYAVPTDPVSGESYEYTIQSESAFSLCARFDTEDNSQFRTFYGDSTVPVPAKKFPVGSPDTSNWNHQKGRICFDRTIDPDFFPPTKFPRTKLGE